MPGRSPAPPMFACGGYGIADERLLSHREITIHADDGPVPRLGDPFTILRDGGLHDLIVLSVLRSGLGWAARCGVVKVG